MGDFHDEFIDVGSGKEPGKSMPDNFHLWAVLSAFFCFFPTGIIAVSYSNKVGKLWGGNREKEAEKAAAKARRWTWATFVLGMLFGLVVLSVVVYVSHSCSLVIL